MSKTGETLARVEGLPRRTPVVVAGIDEAVGIGVLGATGYGGAELIRLLGGHPHASLRAASSRQGAGKSLASQMPSLPGRDLILDDDPLEPGPWIDRGVDVVFCALPHGAFAARAGRFLEAGIAVIDLSGDFRLRDAGEYERRYHMAHPAPHLLGSAVYGLTEWRGAEVEASRFVANPGCYATSILLAVLPAVEAGLWSGEPIIANALSGVSGAGRAPSLTTHFVECGSGAAPYRVGEEHAHLGEVRQEIADRIGSSAGSAASQVPRGAGDRCRSAVTERPRDGHGPQSPGPLILNPHLVPMSRGILASISVPMTRLMEADAVRALYSGRYAECPFVRVLESEALPETRHVRGSNRCDIAVRTAAQGTMLLVFAAIDNLVKGAAGQAIQNWNRMQGWPETTGLPLDGFGS